jgi:hypothetical protein
LGNFHPRERLEVLRLTTQTLEAEHNPVYLLLRRWFIDYKTKKDFVGMDMTRKFLQMGWTRSRRYANHKTGRKWNADRSEVLPQDVDKIKAESARIFYEVYVQAREDKDYKQMMQEHKQTYEGPKNTVTRSSSAVDKN